MLDLAWGEVLGALGIDVERLGGFCVEPSWNVAPTHDAIIVRAMEGDAGLEACSARWGLIPAWAEEASMGARMFNARSETAHEKPSFRSPLRRRRCVVPMSGFYEWSSAAGSRSAYYVSRSDGAPLLAAGLWERWAPSSGGAVESFTILTREASDAFARWHDRMPCVLETGDVRAWLDGARTVDEVRALLRGAPEDAFGVVRVSSRVNSVAHNDPSLLEPIDDERQGELFG